MNNKVKFKPYVFDVVGLRVGWNFHLPMDEYPNAKAQKFHDILTVVQNRYIHDTLTLNYLLLLDC